MAHIRYIDEKGNIVQRPASIIDPQTGTRVVRPSDALLAAHGIYRARYMVPDSVRDMIMGYTFEGVSGGCGVFRPITRDANELANEQRATYVAGAAQLHGEAIGKLVYLLGLFGLSMPIPTDEATAAIYAALKSGTTQGTEADAMLLLAVRNGLPLTDKDIYDAVSLMAATPPQEDHQ